MNASWIGSNAIAGWVDSPIVLVLAAKWTVILGLAWLAHGLLAGQNPRWRVTLWRWAMIGVVLIAVLSLAPPIVRYPLAPRGPAVVDLDQGIPTMPVRPDRRSPEAIAARAPTGAIDARPASSPAAGIAGVTNPVAASRRAEPVADEGRGSLGDVRAVEWSGLIWLAGVLVLTARLILGTLSLAALVQRSAEVPERIVRECRAIADRLGCAGAVPVRRSAQIVTPCLTGLRRPILLLPDRQCRDIDRDDLRAILAHELAHARNRDLAWNLAAHLATILLWFHPLAWWIRAAHAAACDAVSDAIAADLVGDVASYGRTLARLAVRAAWPAPSQGLAMAARGSDVRRRLDALNRKVFRTPLSWRRVMPAMLVESLLLVVIGGFGVTRAEPGLASGPRRQPANAESPPMTQEAAERGIENKAGRLVLRAVAAETNEPIDGVSIEYTLRIDDGKFLEATVNTSEDGSTVIEWPAVATVHKFWFTARAPKRVPIHINWDDDRHPIQLPAQKELRFEPGTTIGGIVRDESGQPIQGATVKVHGPPTESEGRNSAFTLGSSQTDAQGRWRQDAAPNDLSNLWANVEHPHHLPNGTRVSHELNSVTVLKRGLTVTGRIDDAAGRPVRGARVLFGPRSGGTPGPPRGTTKERGEFTLENCEPGPSIITVEAEGLAPRIEDVRVEAKTAPVEIRMTEPGSILRVKVVDVQGKPIAGAFVGASNWRGHQTIQFWAETDRDGRLVWRSAPKDAVRYNISKAEYMWMQAELMASEREQTVTLHPKLVISGRVTDADTGGPVPKFHAVRGWKWRSRDAIDWSENLAIEVTGGQFTVPFDEARAGAFIRIDAPGYKSALSRAFRADEGSQTFDVALHPAKGYTGLVLLPDGKPAPGAEVALATQGNPVSIRSGHFDRNWDFPTTSTGPDGRFIFPARDDKFLLVAVSEAGYAEVSSDEFAKSGKLVLQPWGRIEGGVRIGSRFGPDQEVVFQPDRPNRAYFWSFGYTTRTDERGRFGFDWVIPGSGRISRSVVTKLSGGASQHMPCWPEFVEVKPAQTVQVTIGGKGRPVTGRIAVDGTPEAPIDWTRNEPVEIAWFAAHIDKDGRFRIEDIPSGRNTLDVRVNAPSHGAGGPVIGRAKRDFTLPEMADGRSNEPLDLGTITVELEGLQIGDLAPDFDVERIGTPEKGRRVKLSDYRGKLVLLDFWAGWQDDMTVLKEVQEKFGSDPRFVLISLACAQKSSPGLEKFIKEGGLSWTNGVAGDLASGVAARYKIRAIQNMVFTGPDHKERRVPLTFLIGPDGRIVAHDLLGTDLEAVRKALANPNLFPRTDRTTPGP
jgi:beta-lactamase regulating signal transducer with metallopeptidase domain/peroxiredoxin